GGTGKQSEFVAFHRCHPSHFRIIVCQTCVCHTKPSGRYVYHTSGYAGQVKFHGSGFHHKQFLYSAVLPESLGAIRDTLPFYWHIAKRTAWRNAWTLGSDPSISHLGTGKRHGRHDEN